MSYIYSISDKNGKCLYVGQTTQEKVETRWKQHRRQISKGVHKIKQLNSYNIEDLQFEVLMKVDTDCSLILSTLENFYNSLLHPLNRCIATSFRGASVTFKREENKELCEEIIEVIGKYY
jgi:hypothetical protein